MMTETRHGEIRIDSEIDIVTARRVILEVGTALSFGITDVTRIVTAASELARNTMVHAGSGVMRWRVLEQDGATGIELVFEDQGPGIANVEQALEKGFSTGRGLGMGLPGAQRLMDEMKIESTVGGGTTVLVRKWRRR